MTILPKKFYQRDTVIVAKNLLGKKLVRRVGNYEMSGIITETEAYRHKDDPASHAFKKITDRNSIMFGEVGIAYVYFTYGMHYCFNVVAKNDKISAGAVLIRGINPEKGIKRMQLNRGKNNLENVDDATPVYIGIAIFAAAMTGVIILVLKLDWQRIMVKFAPWTLDEHSGDNNDDDKKTEK